MRALALVILILMCAPPTCSSLSLSISLYNSDDSLSVDLFGSGFEFESMSALMPDSLFYSNGGSSVTDSCFYSYEAVLNGEKIGSGAETNSGGFGFSTVVNANYNGDGSREFKHSASSNVEDGDLRTYTFNSNHRTEEEIHTENAAYSQKAMISPGRMASSGSGTTDANSDPDPADDSAYSPKGAQGIIKVTGPGTTSTIEQNVIGDTDFLWIYSFSSNKNEYSFFRGAKGVIITEASLGMIGESTDFPTQVLPPGGISIVKHEYDPWRDNVDREEVLKRFSAEIEEFKNTYQNSILTPAAWYYLDQVGYLRPIESGDTGTSHGPSGYFKMSMQFDVGK